MSEICILIYRYVQKRRPHPLKFIHLLPSIPQILQHARQLPLILRALLHPRNRLIQPGRPTHKHLDILLLRLRQHRLQQLLGDMAAALRPAVRGLVEQVEGAEALRVGVFEVFEFALQQDVFFGQVAEDEGDFCFVGGVLEDGARELVHSVNRPTSALAPRRKRKRESRVTDGVMPVPPAINAI